jgi:MYXO-CTERM domain-containing protein
MVFSGDPLDPTPFEVALEIPAESGEGWAEVGFSWASFELAEWASEGGLSEVDPMRMIGYGLNLGAGETSREGTIWIDDLGLSEGPSSPLVAATPTVAVTASMEAQSAPTPTPTAVSVASAEERGEEVGGEEGPARGICPGAALALPLAALCALAVGRRRT